MSAITVIAALLCSIFFTLDVWNCVRTGERKFGMAAGVFFNPVQKSRSPILFSILVGASALGAFFGLALAIWFLLPLV